MHSTSSTAPAGSRHEAVEKEIEEYRKNAHAMVDFIADYYRGLYANKYPVVSPVKSGFITENPRFTGPPPEEPCSFEDLLKEVEGAILPGVTHWQHPHFFAYFPASTSFPSQVADMLSGAVNIVGFSWIASPAATELEVVALDWVASALDLPKCFHSSGKGGGVIQVTASDAVLVVLLAARERALRHSNQALGFAEAAQLCDGDDHKFNFGKLVAYVSDQAHSSVTKSAKCAGLRVRIIPTTYADKFALQPATLLEAMRADAAAGYTPAFVCGTVGTTSTTAVDPLREIAHAVRGEFGDKVWLHVDAAYAGSTALLPEYRHHFEGSDLYDSFNFNPHKFFGVGFDCSALFVRDRSPLLDLLSAQPEYLRNKASESGRVVDYKDWQVALGRRFRALKLYFLLKLKGLNQLREEMRRKLQLAVKLEEMVKADSRFELVVPRTFGLVCLRIKGLDNAGQERLLEAVNSSAENFFVIHTKAADMFIFRVACSSQLADESHVELLWSVIQREAQKILDSSKGAAASSAPAAVQEKKIDTHAGKKTLHSAEGEGGEVVDTPDGPMRVVCDGDVCRLVPVKKK